MEDLYFCLLKLKFPTELNVLLPCRQADLHQQLALLEEKGSRMRPFANGRANPMSESQGPRQQVPESIHSATWIGNRITTTTIDFKLINSAQYTYTAQLSFSFLIEL